jgi:hypothetical protein
MPVAMGLQLALALDDIPHQLQSLDRKPLHIRRTVTTPRLNLPRHRLPSIFRNCKRHIPRRPIPAASPCRPRRPALTNSIRAAQRLARMFR